MYSGVRGNPDLEELCMRKVGMLFVFAFCVCVSICGFTQDVAEGQWIQLFDGESLYGWIVFGDANWSVQNGILTASRGTGGWIATTSSFADFQLYAKLKVSGEGSAGLVFRSPLEGHYTENGAGAIILNAGGEYEVNVRAVGKEVSATVNGSPVEGLNVNNLKGRVGILYHRYHDKKKPAVIEVQTVQLKPLQLKSLFNGKDLTGWNILPGHKSVFSVVDGALNIKDGGGQIETDGVYKNFLLQLDIFVNGDKLNSGVFFRGPKGVFWKGYESQIKNGWLGNDRSKPVDFGTGGIYGVQESRKVVSNDKEWFTKTIVCDGNHMAVWLNGYLVCDLLDTRPVHPEGDGKNGYVPSAGTIHLQGHDPTTDLSFKNINIQVYPDK